MEMDLGVTGAKRQSHQRANPRNLLKRLLQKHKDTDREAIFRIFLEELRISEDHDELMDTILEYWFANNYHSLIMEDPEERIRKTKDASRRREAVRKDIANKLDDHIKKQAMILLLDTMLPNGKPLRDTTFGECADIGGKLSTIAKQGKPDQLVGSVLTDKQLRALQK